MKVAVIGAAGQLGRDLVRVFLAGRGYEVLAWTHNDVEVADRASVEALVRRERPEVVINTAAFHRVDECEEQAERTFAVNAVGALNVARACAETNALCVYVSTDYVFDGTAGQPYTEESVPHPINVYGVSKLAGEQLVQQATPRWVVARIASLFGEAGVSGKGSNFIETILARARDGHALRLVGDIYMSPTCAASAAAALERLIRMGSLGLFHITNQGSCSWHDFAVRALALANLQVPIERISVSEWPVRARRPANSTLTSVRLPEKVREPLVPWERALYAYMRSKGHAVPLPTPSLDR